MDSFCQKKIWADGRSFDRSFSYQVNMSTFPLTSSHPQPFAIVFTSTGPATKK